MIFSGNRVRISVPLPKVTVFVKLIPLCGRDSIMTILRATIVDGRYWREIEKFSKVWWILFKENF
jgi:hypothetical protein